MKTQTSTLVLRQFRKDVKAGARRALQIVYDVTTLIENCFYYTFMAAYGVFCVLLDIIEGGVLFLTEDVLPYLDTSVEMMFKAVAGWFKAADKVFDFVFERVELRKCINVICAIVYGPCAMLFGLDAKPRPNVLQYSLRLAIALLISFVILAPYAAQVAQEWNLRTKKCSGMAPCFDLLFDTKPAQAHERLGN